MIIMGLTGLLYMEPLNIGYEPQYWIKPKKNNQHSKEPPTKLNLIKD